MLKKKKEFVPYIKQVDVYVSKEQTIQATIEGYEEGKTRRIYKNIPLPSGQLVSVTIQETNEKIDRPVKVVDGVKFFSPDYVIPKFRKVKDSNNNVLMTQVTVRGCRLRISFSDGTEMEARSCCKPPDQYNIHTGILRALGKIFKIDSGISLNRFKLGGKIIRDNNVTSRLNHIDRDALKGILLKKGKNKTKTATVATA